MSDKILLIHSSARTEGSVTRTLADELAEALGGPVTVRDVNDGIPLATETFAAKRGTGEDIPALAVSDELIAELKAHDTVIIAAPVYNFTVPASLKAWIDQIARPGETFRYTEDGPVGLLEGKRAFLVVASGGTPVDSDWDFATPYLRHVLGFVGIDEVEVIAADALGNDTDKALDGARARIEEFRVPQAA